MILLLSAASAGAGTWLAPADLSARGGDASDPAVAVDPRGDAVAVWSRLATRGFVVQAAVRAPGGRWQTPVELSTAALYSPPPEVAIAPGGAAVAIWSRYNGRRFVVQAATRAAGGRWRAPVDLGSGDLPQVAVDSRGDAVAVWTGRNFAIQAATLPAGGRWRAPVDLGTGAFPLVAIDPRGDAVAVWDGDGTNLIVQAATRTRGGSWQVPADLSTPSEEAINPQVATDPHGDTTVVWDASAIGGGGVMVQAARLSPGGSWQAPVDLSTQAQALSDPQVAVDSRGGAIAVWERSSGNRFLVQAAALTGGGSWQPPAELANAGRYVSDPQVAVSAGGNAVAVWERNNGNRIVIQAAVRPARRRWQTPVCLSAPGLAAGPRVAVDARGDAVAVWARNNGANSIVQAARYDVSSGRPGRNPRCGP